MSWFSTAKANLLRMWGLLCSIFHVSSADRRVAILAAVGSLVGAVGAFWSARYAGGQAEAARISAQAAADTVPYARAQAEAAVETLRRSDEDLLVVVSVDSSAPVVIRRSTGNCDAVFSVDLEAGAAVVNKGGSPAVVSDAVMSVHLPDGSSYNSRVSIFDATTGIRWARFSVVRPGEPRALRLSVSLTASDRSKPGVATALCGLFNVSSNASDPRTITFSSFMALFDAVRGRSGELAQKEVFRFFYGSETMFGAMDVNPWSEAGEKEHTRVTLSLRTIHGRTYKSSPGLIFLGDDPNFHLRSDTDKASK